MCLHFQLLLNKSVLLLTNYPSHANGLQNGKTHDWHSTASIVVKQQKHIKSSLQQIWKKRKEEKICLFKGKIFDIKKKTQRETSTVCLKCFNFPGKTNLLLPQSPSSDQKVRIKHRLTAVVVYVDGQWERRMDTGRIWMSPSFPDTQTVGKRLVVPVVIFDIFLYYNSVSYPLWVI